MAKKERTSYRVQPKDLNEVIQKTIKETTGKARERSDLALQDATIDRFSAIVRDTPRVSGKAQGNWIFTKGKPSAAMYENPSAKARIEELNKRARTGMFGFKWYFTNNLPYIGVLEFGGYPDPVEKGTYNRDTRQYEIRSIQGYSKMAPKGMVRKNMVSFKTALRRAARNQR